MPYYLLLLSLLLNLFKSFFFSSRRRHTRYIGDWSSDVCSSDLVPVEVLPGAELHVDKSCQHHEHNPGNRCAFLVHEEARIRSEERRVGKECRSRWWLKH